MTNNVKKNISLFSIVFLVSAYVSFAVVSCKDAVVNVTPRASVSLLADTAITDALDTSLVIDSAKFLIANLRLHRGGDSSTIKAGPFRVFVSLNRNLTEWGASGIPAGTYSKAGFKIHKHNPGEPLPDNDTDFLDSTGQVGYSAVIAGSWNGIPFVYKSEITVWQKYTLSPELVVPASVDALYNITVLCEYRRWFRINGVWVNPMDPAYRNDNENSIKDSFLRAYKDLDKNGVPDP